jgi:membrane fusion protein, multidrug efflux system
VFSVPQDRVPEVQERLAAGAKLPATAFDRTRVKQLATGSFSTLDNLVDTQTGTVKAKARFVNADGALFPNQFVNLRLLLRTVTSAVVVPVTAMRNGPNGDYVYVLNADNTVSQRVVTRGESSVDNIAVTAGLNAGEVVVTEGGDRLKDGARVQTQADRPAVAPGAAANGQHRGGRRQREGAQGGAQGGQAPAGGAASSAAPAAGGNAAPTPGTAPAAPATAPAPAAAPATGAQPAAPAAAPTAAAPKLPTAEQRQRMLDAVKDDPEQLERRKRFLEQLDRGDPAALERWQRMAERQGGQGEGRRQAPQGQ